MKETLKPNAYKQSEDVPSREFTQGMESNGVPFVE
jgi:hypothetical protein